MDFAWNSMFLLLPNWVSVFQSEFGLLGDGFKFHSHVCHLPSTFFSSTIMEFLCLSKDTLIDWLLLPQVELVSDSEDDKEVAMAKVRERRRREEEVKRQEEEAKVERWRQKEVSPQRSVLPWRC